MRAERRADRRPALVWAANVQCLLVAAIVTWGALSFGAVYSWGYVPLAGVSIAAAVLGLLAGRRRRAVPTAVAIAFAALIVAVLVQEIPLPRSILARISPATTTLLAQYDVLFAAPGAAAAHALSVDPRRTWAGLSLLVSFGLLWLGLTAMLNERLAVRIVRTVIVVGLAIAVIGIVAFANANGKVYGFWQPHSPAAPFGPFVNRNHFAGWMLMSIPLGIGYFLSLVAHEIAGGSRSWHRRLVWLSTPAASRLILVGLALIVMTVSVLLSLSRSGIACLALGLVTFGYVASRRLFLRSHRAIVAGCLVIAATACVGWVGADKVSARFGEFRADPLGGRPRVWHDASTVIRTFPLAGTGLDTFGVAMLFYQTTRLDEFYEEAHSDYLQLAAEGGLLVGVPVLALIFVTAIEVRRRFCRTDGTPTAYWLRAGAVTGMFLIAVQEMSEFSLQMPGNAALFCVLAAVALHRPDRVTRVAGRSTSIR